MLNFLIMIHISSPVVGKSSYFWWSTSKLDPDQVISGKMNVHVVNVQTQCPSIWFGSCYHWPELCMTSIRRLTTSPRENEVALAHTPSCWRTSSHFQSDVSSWNAIGIVNAVFMYRSKVPAGIVKVGTRRAAFFSVTCYITIWSVHTCIIHIFDDPASSSSSRLRLFLFEFDIGKTAATNAKLHARTMTKYSATHRIGIGIAPQIKKSSKGSQGVSEPPYGMGVVHHRHKMIYVFDFGACDPWFHKKPHDPLWNHDSIARTSFWWMIL